MTEGKNMTDEELVKEARAMQQPRTNLEESARAIMAEQICDLVVRLAHERDEALGQRDFAPCGECGYPDAYAAVKAAEKARYVACAEVDVARAAANLLFDDLVKAVAALQQAILKQFDPDDWVEDAQNIVAKCGCCRKLNGTNDYCTLLRGHPGECSHLPPKSPCLARFVHSENPDFQCRLNKGHSGAHQWVSCA